MSKWNIVVRRDVNTKRSVASLVSDLKESVSDDSVGAFFKHSFLDDADPIDLVLILKLLATSSLRGSSLNYTPELRNKKNWVKLVDMVGSKALSLKHPRHADIWDTNSHFISFCSSLSRLRFGDVQKLRRVPHDPFFCFPHLLRFTAEMDQNVELVVKDADVFAQVLLQEKTKSPAWLSTHLAMSLAMLVHRDVKYALSKHDSLRKINAWVWKDANSRMSSLSKENLVDLFESYLALKEDNPDVHGDLFLKMRAAAEQSPRVKQIHTSRFQTEVAQVLNKLSIPFQSEALEGKLDFLLTVNRQKLGLQCYGPSHFTFDSSTKLEGRTVFQEFLCRPLLVKHLVYQHWERAADMGEKESMIKSALANHK